jgi:predicted nucleic acid-binding protein
MMLADIARAADLVEKYADLPLGTADACVIALAERLGVTRVATLDKRHFSVVKPRHIPCVHTVALAKTKSPRSTVDTL